ncbi:hypothetical protein RJ639_038265 [Escallonia herrerae]|uniref:Oleosin n=1 Tax=Escallonia herrerae TaxID=1293975 RepID=A0AA88WL88_9ASTE|nr:hypothetical protein RJ639_038265 [Escallonia herrerae]
MDIDQTSLSSSSSSSSLAIDNSSSQNPRTAQNQPRQQPKAASRWLVKNSAAVTLSSSLMTLSGPTLAATVMGLVVATPVLLIFSPVLVPAAVTLFLLFAGFLASGGLGATATFVLYWTYRFLIGKRPLEQLKKMRGRNADLV